MKINKIGVIGGGIMGAGIIHTLLNAGLMVSFKEMNQDLIDKSLQMVEKIFDGLKEKGKITEDDIQEKMKAVTGFLDYESFSDSDLVIEAVPERMEFKSEVFMALDKICHPDTILASNTSSLSISQLGGLTQRPENVIGMHWFNPAHIMKLIEVVPGLETSDDTREVLFQLCSFLGKIPVQVKECAGFLVNRLLGIYVNEALFMVQEGYSPSDIDHVMEDLGMPMGPITLGEMVGWDTIRNSNTTLKNEYGSRFDIPSLLEELYGAERCGAKTGRGLYEYEGHTMVKNYGEKVKDPESLSSRLLSVMLNEGVRCLDENVASLKEIDIAVEVGAGMPKGPLAWADERGLDILLTQLIDLKDTYGERFLPAPLLKRKVAAGHLGKKSGKGFHRY